MKWNITWRLKIATEMSFVKISSFYSHFREQYKHHQMLDVSQQSMGRKVSPCLQYLELSWNGGTSGTPKSSLSSEFPWNFRQPAIGDPPFEESSVRDHVIPPVRNRLSEGHDFCPDAGIATSLWPDKKRFSRNWMIYGFFSGIQREYHGDTVV